MAEALAPDTAMPGRAPTVLEADASVDIDADRLREALIAGAPVVAVLCARGLPLSNARAALSVLASRLRPIVDELRLRVSRSATDGLAAWAASACAPVGIDVQRAPSSLGTAVSGPSSGSPSFRAALFGADALDDALLDAALTAEERRWLVRQARPEMAFARLWAAKEAVLKAFGVGLAWPPNRLHVGTPRSAWRRVSRPPLGDAWCCDLDLAGDAPTAIAVALNAGQVAP